MGKRPVPSKLPNPSVIDVAERTQFNAALGSILTADEYCNAVTALVKGVEDVSEDNVKMADLSSAVRRLLLSRYDPPLPLWWTFIAVEKSLWLDGKGKDPLDVGTGILNFASGVSRSLNSLAAVNARGRTALAAAAPILGLLYDVASLLSSTCGSVDETEGGTGTVESNGKKVRKLARRLRASVKELLGFTVLCHCKDSKAFERSFSLPVAPDVPLECFPDFVFPPLPLASKKMARSLSRDSLDTDFLAGIVFGEVVLLQLVVETIHRRILLKKQKTNFEVGQDDFVQRLKNLAVLSVWAAGSSSPSEMLLDLLLEKRLPVLDLLDAKEEILVRGVLFETVLVPAPLFRLLGETDGESKSSDSGLDHTSVLFMKKLSVARRAVAFFRSQEERSRLAAIQTQMTSWHVPPKLLKWLRSQKKQQLSVIALQDQQSLTNWLVNTAEKSVFTALLDKSVATWSSRLTSVGTSKNSEVLEVESGDAHSDRDGGADLFFVDTAGETQAAIDAEATADLDFTSAAMSMKGEGDKIMKKKKKRAKVLFHRHKQSSKGTKRSMMEIDDLHLTSSSGSDSEENGSKSAKKKVKKSKREVVDVIATSEESEDDDSDAVLASIHLSPKEENSLQGNSGDVSNQQEAVVRLPQLSESPKHQIVKQDEGFGKGVKAGAADEEAIKVQHQVLTRTTVESEELRSLGTPLVSSKGTPSVGIASTSHKGEEEQQCELLCGVGTEERPSASDKEMVITAISENEIEIQNSSAVSQADPVLLSVGKSAKKKKESKDPEDPDTGEPADTPGRSNDESSSVSNKQLVSRDPETNTEGKGDVYAQETIVVDIQNPSIVSQAEPVPSVGKSPKKEKKTKDPNDPDISERADTVGSRKDGPLSTVIPNKQLVDRDPETSIEGISNAYEEENIVLNTEIQAVETRADVQEEVATDLAQEGTTTNSEEPPSSPPVSHVEPGLLSVGSSSKKKNRKSQHPAEPDTVEPLDTKDGPLSTSTPRRKLLNGYLKANIEHKGNAHVEENIITNPELHAVEAISDVQGRAAKDLAEKGKTPNYEESPASILTPQKEGADIAWVEESPCLRNVQEDANIGKSGKMKRRKPKLDDEDDELQIFDTIKHEVVTQSATFSSVDLIDALLVGKSLTGDDQHMSSRKMRTLSQRSRIGEESNRDSAWKVSPEKTSGANPTEDGEVSQRDLTLAEEEAILSATLMKEILGSPRAEYTNGRMDSEDELIKSTPGFPEANEPIDTVVLGLTAPIVTEPCGALDCIVLGVDDGAKDTTETVVKPTEPPGKDAVQGTRVRTQGTPALITIGASLGTPASRKTKSKGQADVGLPAKAEERVNPKSEAREEALDAKPAEMSEGGKGQDEVEVTTPDAEGKVSDVELVTSVKQSSRKRKMKPDTPQSLGSETTDEIPYQRRTRSGRALGAPVPTPTKKGNMRRKLVLEPLVEEQ